MTGNDITAAICRFARSALHARGIVFLVMVITAACSVGIAGPPVNKAIEKEADKIRVVLQANFQACNEENLPALMETLSHTMPGQQQFEAEARQLFEDADVYLRLEDFKLIQFSPPFAAARVVQVTLPAAEKDREAISGRQQAYRGNSALLPEWERCVYTQTFHKSNGKWKVHLITDMPREAPADPE